MKEVTQPEGCTEELEFGTDCPGAKIASGSNEGKYVSKL